jgi:putative ABC transport system ATP-binding protein/lipoprotein-releasing system ATP-binding protein
MNRIWRMRHGKFERVDERPVCTGTG